MRKFSSYGPIDQELYYYVPRQELIDSAYQELLGENPDKGGHYITVWAPRQTGKTWIMREAFLRLQQNSQFDVVFLSLQYLCNVTDVDRVAQLIANKLIKELKLLKNINIDSLDNFDSLFELDILTKPLILIFDEFDALDKAAIAGLVSVFRHIYNTRQNQVNKSTAEKTYLLHSMALIGVRAVLGIENLRGSPFNVQRSVHIPNLTADEVVYLFNQYQQESGQDIKPDVVERIYYEFKGQPGLTCWFGELLTETYNKATDKPITMENFERVYAASLNLLPNNNIINIISKARQEAYKPLVLELFKTKTETKFFYDEPVTNFLYMNGVIDVDETDNSIKFASPYIQKRLFNYFARELFLEDIDYLLNPFDDVSDTITETKLNVRRLLQRYEQYLQVNREIVLKNAPRRQNDLRVYEAVFHFHLYFYLASFLGSYDGQVQPEFPTGNGTIDLLIRYAGKLFGLELKSFANQPAYRKALIQCAKYGQQLGVKEIWLVLFIESVDETNRKRFEADYMDDEIGVMVHPQFVQTGRDNRHS